MKHYLANKKWTKAARECVPTIGGPLYNRRATLHGNELLATLHEKVLEKKREREKEKGREREREKEEKGAFAQSWTSYSFKTPNKTVPFPLRQ